MALGSPTSAQSVGNWDINYLSLVTDFGVDSTDEVVVKYEIGKDRAFNVDLFDKGCINPITGITISKNPVRTPKDDIHDLLDIKLDIPKSSLSKSNIWTAFSSKVEFCARLQLKTEGGMVIKEDPRDIGKFFLPFLEILLLVHIGIHSLIHAFLTKQILTSIFR